MPRLYGWPEADSQGDVSSGWVWSRPVTLRCVGPVRAGNVGLVCSEENNGLRKYPYQADLVRLGR